MCLYFPEQTSICFCQVLEYYQSGTALVPAQVILRNGLFYLGIVSCPHFLLTVCASYGDAVAMSLTLGKTYAFVPFHPK